MEEVNSKMDPTENRFDREEGNFDLTKPREKG